jgi:hypothetical protein
VTARVVSRRPVSVDAIWAERLGVEEGRAGNELVAQFEHLSQFVLCGGMPRQGKAGSRVVSAEAATAFGELWVLEKFLAAARDALTGSEATR